MASELAQIPGGPPVEGDAVTVLDQMVRLAASWAASDIHLEPKDGWTQVRFRIDGGMTLQRPLGPALAQQIVTRIKVLARMDIAERRAPQDGQLSLEGLPGQRLNLRASTFPTSWGEKVVMRLQLAHALIPFDRLGFDELALARVRDVIRRPQGFVLACGPTGSGKTSTLYSMLGELDVGRQNIVTLEDPIEVELGTSITQGQTNPRGGFTFATGLRALLRQDPDVIMVGEIRDGETAGIALQAALTGQIVFSSLHTADATETIVRLVDLGVEPWVVANALSLVVAQRLVRIPCVACRREIKLEADVWDGDEVLLPQGTEVVRPRGCDACHGTGYRGRTAIFEIVELDDELRDLVKRKAPMGHYRAIMQKRGLMSLRRIGVRKAQQGLTTIDEVVRVTV